MLTSLAPLRRIGPHGTVRMWALKLYAAVLVVISCSLWRVIAAVDQQPNTAQFELMFQTMEDATRWKLYGRINVPLNSSGDSPVVDFRGLPYADDIQGQTEKLRETASLKYADCEIDPAAADALRQLVMATDDEESAKVEEKSRRMQYSPTTGSYIKFRLVPLNYSGSEFRGIETTVNKITLAETLCDPNTVVTFKLHVTARGVPFTLSYGVLRRSGLAEDATAVAVVSLPTASAGIPDEASEHQQARDMPPAGGAPRRVEPQEKSFIAKYWWVLLSGVLLVSVLGGDTGETPAQGHSGTQIGQTDGRSASRQGNNLMPNSGGAGGVPRSRHRQT